MLEKGDVLYDVGGFFKKSLIPTWKATNGMNPLTLEWAENAEEDYATAKLL